MAKLSTEDLGDVEVEYYQNIVPGTRAFVWYADDNVWHEVLIGLIVSGDEVYIYTPDGDLYREKINCKGESGPTRLRGLTEKLGVPRNIRRSYRFRERFTDEIIRKVIRDSLAAATDEGLTVDHPSHVRNAAGDLVTFESFFGGNFVRHRMRGKGAADARGPEAFGDSPKSGGASPKNARIVAAAPPDSVWVAAEPLGGLLLGQEVCLNPDSDIQAGDRTAMALRKNVWVKIELIPVADAAGYADVRRKIFVGPAEVLLDAPRAGSSKDVPPVGDPEDDSPHGDVRTLWVDYDTHGERYKAWKEVCSESFKPVQDSKPIDGPCTALHLLKHTLHQGGDPRLWMQLWARAKHLEPTDRTFHEMKMLTEVLFLAGTYDQVNIPSLMSMEVVCRRIQAIVDAYMNPSKPSWENAKIFTGQSSPEDIVSPVFKTYAVKRNKEELELLQARQKVRELRGAPVVALEDGATDVVDALPKKPPKPPRRPKGGGGQGDS